MDGEYLKSLDQAQLKAGHWIATHPPRPRNLEDLPPISIIVEAWEKLPYSINGLKIYPTYKNYMFWVLKFGMVLDPEWTPGIPADIIKKYLSSGVASSRVEVLTWLYEKSSSKNPANMRLVFPSIGWMLVDLDWKKTAIKDSLRWLRNRRLIRCIWLGYKNAPIKDYLHSCYELPYNCRHVGWWKAQHIFALKKDQVIIPDMATRKRWVPPGVIKQFKK